MHVLLRIRLLRPAAPTATAGWPEEVRPSCSFFPGLLSPRRRVRLRKRWSPQQTARAGCRGHPFREDRRVVEGIIYRSRTGIAWRDLPWELFGPWQTVWKRHRRYEDHSLSWSPAGNATTARCCTVWSRTSASPGSAAAVPAPVRLQGTKHRGTLLREEQAMAGHRHPLRQARHHLPRRPPRLPRMEIGDTLTTERQRELTEPNRRAIGASSNGRAAIQAPTMRSIDALNIQNPVQFSASAVGSLEPWAAYM